MKPSATPFLRFFLATLIVFLFAFGAQAQTTAHFDGYVKTLGGGSLTHWGVAVDGSGNVYIASAWSAVVMKIPAGCASSTCVKTLGGGFSSPYGVAVDGSGNVYVADFGGSAVKEIPVSCTAGTNDATCVETLGGGFSNPTGVAVDGSGNVYAADYSSATVKKILATCIAGANDSTCVTTLGGGFYGPAGVAVDGNGNIYVADYDNNAMKEIPASCIAGTNNAVCVKTLGSGFSYPPGVAVDGNGNVYVADYGHNAVKKIPATCISGTNDSSCVTTLGSGFSYPAGVAVDGNGNVYVADYGNNAAKEIELNSVDFGSLAVGGGTPVTQTLTFTIDTAGSIAAPSVRTMGARWLDFTDAGSGSCTTNGSSYSYIATATCTVDVSFNPLYAGTRNGAVVLKDTSGNVLSTVYLTGTGTGPQVVFSPSTVSILGDGVSSPISVTVDGSGNVYVADVAHSLVKEMPAGCASSTCVQTLGGGFSYPFGVAVDGGGNIYVADTDNGAVKAMPAGCASSTCVKTLGGGFQAPARVAVDGSGNIYVADADAGKVKEIPAGCASSTCVKTLGGGFIYPIGVAVDGSGNVYVADEGNNTVKEIPSTCIAGANDSTCMATLGGGFNAPDGVAVDGSGNVYVADVNNHAVKEIPSTCIAGANDSTCVVTLDSGFSYPASVAVDGSGNVYATDASNNAVEKIARAMPPALTFATSTVYGETDTADGSQQVTVSNIGNAALSFYSLDLSNAALASATTCSVSSTLAAGSDCVLDVEFAPMAVGSPLAGYVNVVDDHLNATASPYATQTISVSGTATKASQAIAFTSSASATYGSTLTLAATGGNSGNSVTFSLQSGPATLSGSTLTFTGAGTVKVAADQAGNDNYNAATEVTQSIAVSPVLLTVLATPGQSKVYGATDPTLSYSITSGALVGSDKLSGLLTRTAGESVGSYAIAQGTLAASSNYSLTFVPANFAINAEPLTVTAAAASKVYGATDPTLSYSITSGALVGSDKLTGSLTRTAGESVGSYAIAQGTLAASSNYSLTFVPANFAINAEPLTVTATSGQSKVYGATDPTLSYSITSGALVGSDKLTGSLTRTAGESVGSYAIAQGTLAASSNYSITFVPANFAINKAAASVTPAAASKTYGASDPALSGSLAGFIAFDNVTAAYSRASGETVAGGPYTISATLSPSSALANYNVTYNTANFTIAPAPLTVAAQDASMAYGSPLPSLTGTLTGVVNNDAITATYATTATSSSPAGKYVITATLVDANNKLSNYSVTNKPGTLTIDALANVTVTLSTSSTTSYYGDALTFAAKVSGSATGKVDFYDGGTLLSSVTLESGSATYSNSSLAVATHSLTAVYEGSTNYAGATSNTVSVTVNAPAVTLNGSTTITSIGSISVRQGGNGAAQFTLGKMGTLTGAVTVACSGLPAGLTCELSSSSIDAANLPAAVTVTVTSAGLKITGSNRGLAPMGLSLAMLLPGIFFVRRNRKLRMAILAAIFVLLMVLGLSACGGNGSGVTNSSNVTPVGSYTGTITATSTGAATVTTNLTVVVAK
jgi:sugar lactone lactonase YvrE